MLPLPGERFQEPRQRRIGSISEKILERLWRGFWHATSLLIGNVR